MKAPKVLKVTPEVWESMKSDLQRPYYAKMAKGKRYSKVGEKHGLSDTVAYNINNTDSYMEYLEFHAPSGLEWYKSTLDVESVENEAEEGVSDSVESEVVAELRMSDIVDLAMADFHNFVEMRKVSKRAKFYRNLCFVLALAFMAVSLAVILEVI